MYPVINPALMAAIGWSTSFSVNGVITRRRAPRGSHQRQCKLIATCPVIKALISLFEHPAVVRVPRAGHSSIALREV